VSSYAYASNNPITLDDPTGMGAVVIGGNAPSQVSSSPAIPTGCPGGGYTSCLHDQYPDSSCWPDLSHWPLPAWLKPYFIKGYYWVCEGLKRVERWAVSQVTGAATWYSQNASSLGESAVGGGATCFASGLAWGALFPEFAIVRETACAVGFAIGAQGLPDEGIHTG
jgi:hypothetical protein